MSDAGELIDFLIEADLLKAVERRGVVPAQGGRRENAAEHSWHVALIAVMLHPRLSRPVDLLKTLKLVAIHDLCEIHAGDTYAYDAAGAAGQAEREALSAARVFATAAPADEAALHALRGEFEAAETPEALFAHACDRIAGSCRTSSAAGRSGRSSASRRSGPMRAWRRRSPSTRRRRASCRRSTHAPTPDGCGGRPLPENDWAARSRNRRRVKPRFIRAMHIGRRWIV